MATLSAEDEATKRALQVELIAANKALARIWMERQTDRRRQLERRISELEAQLLAIDPAAVLYNRRGIWA